MDKAARSLALALTFLLLGTHPGTALARAAKVDAEVTRLSKEAHALYKAGKHQEAAQLLLKAYELKPVPELIFNVARSLDEGGAFEESLRYYQRYMDMDGADPELVKRASRALERIRAEVAKKKEADRVAAAAAADEQRRRDAKAAFAATEKIGIGAAVHGEPGAAVGASSSPSPWFYVAGGVAAVGLVAGVGLGLSASSAKAQLSATDELGAKQTLAQSAQGRALGADVGYGVAVVAGGVATWLFLSTPGGGGVAVGPTGASVSFALGP